jgi:fatty acid desaturase
MAARVLGQTRSATWDVLPVVLALAHGVLLLAWPSTPLVAVGLWWNANTISHHFIHRPFFRTRGLNAGFSCYLSFLLGFPQSLWRARHQAHHLAIEGRRERASAVPVGVLRRSGGEDRKPPEDPVERLEPDRGQHEVSVE